MSGLLLALGCHDNSRNETLLTGGGVVVIAMTDAMTFEPVAPIVQLGDTVVWINRGALPHTSTASQIDPPRVVLPAAADTWDSGLVDGNKSFRLVPQVRGEYRYVCSLHRANGMVGRFRVE